MSFDVRQRAELLRAARAAIAQALAGRTPQPPASGKASGSCGGVFVSLHVRDGHELRGCIGSLEPREPLADAVAELAVAAATRDRRFVALGPDELPAIGIQISVLESPRPVRAEDVEVGVHGLLVRHEGRSGLLLPQVPLEHGWDRETFLRMTCRKAGVPEDAWQRADCELLAFRAEIFGEE